jgi:STE24 endopeptidase
MMAISQLHMFTILALFPAFIHAPPLLRSFGFSKEVSAQPPTIVAFLLFQMILTPLEAVVSIAMNAVSRHFEWEADRFAVELQDKLGDEKMNDMGDRLGRALISLHVKNLSTVWVDWMYVAFFSFYGQLTESFWTRYSAYHHSHPTLTERLKGLETFQAQRQKKTT